MSSAPLKIEGARAPSPRRNRRLAIVLIGLWLGVGVPFWFHFIAGEFHDVRHAVPPLVAWAMAGLLLARWGLRTSRRIWVGLSTAIVCVASLGVLVAQATSGFAENAALVRFVRRHAADFEQLRDALLMAPAGAPNYSKWKQAEPILDRLGLQRRDIELWSDDEGRHLRVKLAWTSHYFLSPRAYHKGLRAEVPVSQASDLQFESRPFGNRGRDPEQALGFAGHGLELYRVVTYP